MSQHPPTGPHDGTPESASTPDSADETQQLDQSPYDVPAGATEEIPPAPDGYGRAPDPSASIYATASSELPDEDEGEDDEPERRRRWLVPVVVLVIVLVAGALAAWLLLGGDDEDPLPAPVPTDTPSQTATAGPVTPEPTDTATSEDPTSEQTASEEPTDEDTTAPAGELLESLDDAVTVGDNSFELDGDWDANEDALDDGAVEAYDGVFVSGDAEIEMSASLWPDNDDADAFAEGIVDGIGGEQVESGDTYTNGDGTYWAYLLEDGRGSYVWTTDRGHVLQVTGSTDYVGSFFSNYPL